MRDPKEHELATEAELAEAIASARREAEDSARRRGLILPPPATPPVPEFVPYDHEIPLIEGVLAALSQSIGKTYLKDDWPRVRDNFEREVEGRFAEIGIVAKVTKWEEDLLDPTYQQPTVEMIGRVERHEFDHERQAHEVVNDLLGTGEGGAIKGNLWTPG